MRQPVGRRAGQEKTGSRRFEWRLIRISYFSLQVWGVLLLVAVPPSSPMSLRRSRGGDSLVGRVFSVARRAVDRRIALMTATKDDGDLLEQRYATLRFFTGRVEIQRASDLTWRGAEENMRLAGGDRVRTFLERPGGGRLRRRQRPAHQAGLADRHRRPDRERAHEGPHLLGAPPGQQHRGRHQEVGRPGLAVPLEMPTATAEVERARLAVEIRPDKRSQVSVYSGQVALDTGTQKVQVADRTTVTISALKQITSPERLLPAPRLRAPRALESFPTSSGGVALTCAWDPVPAARAYRLEIAGTRFFENPVVAREDLRESAFSAPGLGPGIYHVRVAAVDVQGRAGEFAEPVPVRVVLDRAPPFVEVQKFVVLQTGRGREVLVNGRTEPGAAVSIGGSAVSVDGSGYFSAVLKGPVAGQGELEIVARDRAGNVTNLRQAVRS